MQMSSFMDTWRTHDDFAALASLTNRDNSAASYPIRSFKLQTNL